MASGPLICTPPPPPPPPSAAPARSPTAYASVHAVASAVTAAGGGCGAGAEAVAAAGVLGWVQSGTNTVAPLWYCVGTPCRLLVKWRDPSPSRHSYTSARTLPQ